MNHLDTVIARACAALNPRTHYALDVITGGQRWSGADIRGKARKFGAHYARQRSIARGALLNAGGCIVSLGGSWRGRDVTAVAVGQDDLGRALYQTVCGPAVAAGTRVLLVAEA